MNEWPRNPEKDWKGRERPAEIRHRRWSSEQGAPWSPESSLERTLARTPGSEQGHESGLTEGARVRRQPGKHRPGMHEHQWVEWGRRFKSRTMDGKQQWRGAGQAGRKTEAKQQWQAGPSCTVLWFHSYRNSPERAAQGQGGQEFRTPRQVMGHEGDRGTRQPWLPVFLLLGLVSGDVYFQPWASTEGEMMNMLLSSQSLLLFKKRGEGRGGVKNLYPSRFEVFL